VLKQAEDRTPIGEICRKAGISDATLYNTRKKYAGLMPSEMKRLRQLKGENAKLKRIVAGRGHAAGRTDALKASGFDLNKLGRTGTAHLSRLRNGQSEDVGETRAFAGLNRAGFAGDPNS
jgi:methylphosphotriester-DNA--protein-cysteine methyltransferase